MVLLHATDIVHLPHDMPQAVTAKIHEQLGVLDSLYGSTRTLSDDGGYILYIHKDEDCEKALKEVDIDPSGDIVEHVDVIPTDEGEFLLALYLFNNEYGVSVIVSKVQAPQALLDEI